MDILSLLGGLLLILLGANGLTDGAASIAKRFRIPSIVIGLTIVAFGTSAPELTVSVSSALKGSADIAIGNVVGSNIFNTLMIVGCTALFAPIVISRNTLRKEIPLCILSSIVLLICANDVFLDHSSKKYNQHYRRTVAALFFYIIFLGYTFAIAFQGKKEGETEEEIKQLPMWRSILYIIGGLVALIAGGNFFVDGASGIARNLGVSESVIGLTLVAGGTSLPELATSIVAALKKNPEIAIGNVIGSNLFNIFFVLGCSASITPLHLTGITNMDLLVLVGSSILLWIFGLFFAKTHHYPHRGQHTDTLLYSIHHRTHLQRLMEGINISYFMNGAAFMFFGYVSFRLLTHRPRSRIQRILGLTLAFWALLELKDILLYFPSLKTERLVNSLLFIDGWAVAACSFYLLELTAPGWLNWKKIFFTFQPLPHIYNCLFVYFLMPLFSLFISDSFYSIAPLLYS